jgi:prepilin-type N-terminal cleavage/methylation domain-containing protein
MFVSILRKKGREDTAMLSLRAFFKPLFAFRGACLASKGFSLIELGMVMAVLAIFATFALANVSNVQEDSDATTVEAMQSELQHTVTIAAEHLDVSPAGLLAQANALQNILNASTSDNNPNLRVTIVGGQYQVAFNNGRRARLRVNTCGDVCFTGALTQFARYQIVNNTPSCTVDVTPCGELRPL